MLTEKNEYKRLISNRLKENWKSYKILFQMKHYGNCISLMCQELDQVISLLFLLNRSEYEKEKLITQSINNQKWFLHKPDGKKEYITEKELKSFAESLVGWDRRIYEFGFAFKSLSKSYNYFLKDPIRGMKELERKKIVEYIVEYHDKEFPVDFTIVDLVPKLEGIFKRIAKNLISYMEKI